MRQIVRRTSRGVLLLHELLNGRLELCRMIGRVDALAYANNTKRSVVLRLK